MKILLVSDTHGRTDLLEKLLERHLGVVDMVCHMGDFGMDLRKLERKYDFGRMVAVNGNTDYLSSGPQEEIVSFLASGGERRALVVHGHRQAVKGSLDRLMKYAREKEADAVFFGHTHEAQCFTHESIFYMNPGSLTFPRDGRSTYGLVSFTEEGVFLGEIRKSEL